MLKIVEIIKQKFKNLFRKENNILKSESSEFEENINNNKDKEKKEFFELYKNVKSGKIKKENLMINDLIKIEIMLQEEKEYNDEKINNELEEIAQIDARISNLKKKKNKKYTQKSVQK